MRAAIQSVTMWMSRPPESPLSYCWRTLPKNSVLSLISSTYLTEAPYSFSYYLRVPRSSSMYSGQLAT